MISPSKPPTADSNVVDLNEYLIRKYNLDDVLITGSLRKQLAVRYKNAQLHNFLALCFFATLTLVFIVWAVLK